MQNALHRFFYFSHLLAAVILLEIVSILPAVAEKAKVQNIRFVREGETFVIHYNLVSGSAEEKHKVNVILRKRGEKSFKYRPVNVSGDVGPGIVGGEGRQIRWAYHDEFPGGLPESDSYFEIVVDSEVTSVDERPFLFSTPVLIGAGAVVGGVLAILLSSGREDQPLPPVQTPRFPVPPGRP